MVLYPTTKILDAMSLGLMSDIAPDMSKMTFRGSTPALASVVVGDIVLGGIGPKTPSGVLRKVTEVSKVGDSIQFVTTSAGLADAIERGRIRLPGTRLRRDGATINSLHPLGTGADAFDQDFTLGINDIQLGPGVTAGASIGFGVGVDVDLTIDSHKVAGKVVLSGNQSATVDVHASLASKFGPERVPIAVVNFPPIPITVAGVPIVMTTALSVSLGVEGKGSASFDWSATEKAYVNVGAELGTDGFTPTVDGDATASMDPIKITGDLSARAHAELKLAVAVNALMADAALHVGAQGYVKLDADVSESECFTATRGVDAIYGVNASLLGVSIAKAEDRKNLFDKVWDSGACSTDPLAVEPWATVIGASDSDKNPRVAVLSDQSVVIGANKAGTTGYTTRLTPFGAPVWENAIDGTVHVASVGAAPENDGSAWLFGTAQTAPIMMHLGADGSRTTAMLATSSGKPAPGGALYVASKSGGVLMGGEALDESDTFVQWAARIDADGKVAWSKSYGKLGLVRGIAEANDGGILLVGDTTVGPTAAMQLTRISPSGDVVFAKTYGAGRLHGVTAVSSGGIAATGATAQGNGAVVLRIADDGELVWGFSYEDSSPENAEYQGRAIIERSDGLLVAGRRGFGATSDFWALHVSADGGLGWSRAYGGSAYDEVKSVARTSDNGAVLVGETSSFGGTTQTMAIRIPPSGSFVFSSGSGGATKNVEGNKQPLPGAQTTQTAAPRAMNLSTTSASENDWPMKAVSAKLTKL